MGGVPQEDTLDNELSVYNNMGVFANYFGISRRRSRDRIEELLDFVQLRDKWGEQIKNLSGGMKRRLLIARALIHRPRLLILDEPTSNLDAESEVRLRDAMQRIRTKTETTMIVIAHRLATVAMADKILVLDRGLLVTEGPHDELMSADGWYASAFSAQQAVSGRETDERETANA